MMRFAVCDDEAGMAEELAGRVSDFLAERGIAAVQVRCFGSGKELLGCGDWFDVVFLDIRLKEEDGMEVARALRRRGDGCLVVFVTVLEEMVFDAFAVEAFDYLVKPVDSGRFAGTMERVLRAAARREDTAVVIRRGGGCEVVPPGEIAYCEVQGRKLYIHRRDGGVVECYGRLEVFAGQLDGRFFRCHRSYLVNLDCVRRCGGGQAVLSRGETVPVSRLREREMVQALLRRMGERRG